MLNRLTRNRRHIQAFVKLPSKRSSIFFATQPAIQSEENAQSDRLKEFERISRLKIKVRTRKPQKPPFVKNLFLGVFDTDILAYPQFEKEDLDELNSSLKPIESIFSAPNNIARDDFWEELKKSNLIGLQVSQLLGGRELTFTESCRFNEFIYNNSAIALSLINNECFGVQALLKFGNDQQRSKYLPLLTEGKILSTFCIAEEKASDPNLLHTSATLSKDRSHWILNGEKLWVVNGNTADLFIVFAQSDPLKTITVKERKVTAFLIERNSGGISYTPCQPLGINQTDIATVKFENTIVPVENVLGEVHEGNTVIAKLLAELRLGTGIASISLTRNLLNKFADYCCQTNSGTTSLTETDLCRLKVSKIASWLYAMESVAYLTSLLQDQYEDQDCELEAAIVKVLSSKFAHKSTLEVMDLIGSSAYMKDHWVNTLHNDALAFQLLHEANDTLQLITALMGLQYAGIKLKEKIKVIRNPIFHPTEALKRVWSQRRQVEDNPRLTLKLGEYLHPSASLPAVWLEYCVARLQFATETVLARYGPEVIDKHMELMRLADSAMYIYAMAACLGRASRSYCIGLRNADAEMVTATAFCLNARNRVKENIRQIWQGPFAAGDEYYSKMAKRVFRSGKYFAEHPLSRNF